LLGSVAKVLPYFPAQILFSAGVGVVLGCRPGWLAQPWRLGLMALALLPLHMLVAIPINAAARTWVEGDGLAGLVRRTQDWSGTQLWVDSMIAGGALLTQLGWGLWRRSQARDRAWQQAEADNLRLRLSLLQGQLEPHFLFNTLNSIAALVRTAKREIALQAIHRLSELLRYALRASLSPWVSVGDELRFVEEYMALQQLRFGKVLRWHAQPPEQAWNRWASPPLLLQPLVENAVRFGMEAALPGQPVDLEMQLTRTDQHLMLRLTNPHREGVRLIAGHGVGLNKTRERLLALYSERAGIETTLSEDRFSLCLRLPLVELDAAMEASLEDEHAARADRG
jgi:hypothetical protein